MEQSLIDKIKAGTLDEIDKDMLTARLKNAATKIMDECSKSVDRLSELFKEYPIETKLLGISCVVLAQAKAFHRSDGESDVTFIVGTTPNIEKMFENEKGDLNREDSMEEK